MNSKKFSEAMSELDSKYVDEAISYKKKAKKPVWAKWGAIAACFVAVTVLGVGLFQSGLFGSHTDIATLNNGEKMLRRFSPVPLTSESRVPSEILHLSKA